MASRTVASQPTLLHVFQRKYAAKQQHARNLEQTTHCGRVAISTSADSCSAIGSGYTRTRECGHLKLDRSLVKRPVHLYLAEPPSFTPSETPIEVVPEPVADLDFGRIAVDDAVRIVRLMHIHLRLNVVSLPSVGEEF